MRGSTASKRASAEAAYSEGLRSRAAIRAAASTMLKAHSSFLTRPTSDQRQPRVRLPRAVRTASRQALRADLRLTARPQSACRRESRLPTPSPTRQQALPSSRALRKCAEHGLDVLDEPDRSLLDLTQILAATLCRRARRVAPHPGPTGTWQSPVGGEKEGRNHSGRRLNRERRVFANRLLELYKRLLHCQHGRGLADVRVKAHLGPEIFVQLIWWQSIPIVERKRDGALRQPIAYLHESR